MAEPYASPHAALAKSWADVLSRVSRRNYGEVSARKSPSEAVECEGGRRLLVAKGV
jgi:hypothetical protein